MVRLDLGNHVEEHHYQAEVDTPQEQDPLVHHQTPAPPVAPRLIHRAPIINRGPLTKHTAPAVVQLRSPEAPRPHVVRLEQRNRVKPVVRVEQAPVVRVEHHVEQSPIIRVEQAPVRVHSTPRFQPPSLNVKPSAEDLTFLISQQITQSIRNRIPTILSNLQAKQSKQTKAVEPEVSRVTHTVTSTSSQVSSSAAKEGPSHHYVQNSIVGQRAKKGENEDMKEKMEKVDEEKMKMEMERQKVMEGEDVILPQPAPMLVEDTREHKPVWTVTRQRPKQTTVRPPPPRKTKIQGNQVQPKVVKKVCWIGGGRSALTCKQVRRKLIGEDGNAQTGRRRIQSLRQKSGAKPAEKKQKSRMLLHVDPQNENELEKEFSFELANRVDEVDSEERRAITLKEAFDRTINKLGKEVEEEEKVEDLENMDADRFLPTNFDWSDLKCYAGYEACLRSTRTP